MRVLLVEDNRDTLVSLAAILRFEKFEVMTARDAVVGLELAKLYPPDVALLDIGLPGMDGYQLARALRYHITDRKLYIAAVTGYGTEADKRRAVDAGIDAHVSKPADSRMIVQLLKDLASGREKIS